MGKKNRRDRSQRVGNGVKPTAPAEAPGAPAKTKRKLSEAEALAVQLLEASNLLDKKNQEIGDLTQQVVNLKVSLLNAQNQNQALKRAALAKKFGLPQGVMSWSEGEDGVFTLEYDTPAKVETKPTEGVKSGKVDPEPDAGDEDGDEDEDEEQGPPEPPAEPAQTPAAK